MIGTQGSSGRPVFWGVPPPAPLPRPIASKGKGKMIVKGRRVVRICLQSACKFPQNKKSTCRINDKCLILRGWGTRIRTSISGVRVRCLAVRPSPSRWKVAVKIEGLAPVVKGKSSDTKDWTYQNPLHQDYGDSQEIINPA